MHPLYKPVAELMRSVSHKIILPYFQNLKTAEIEEKAPGDLVTIADKLSEEMLTASLSSLIPDAAIVGEEASAADPKILDRLADDVVWIIDPIDATGNFAAGRSPFGIIIALAEADETIAGWFYDPLSQRLCHTSKGAGAFINGKSVRANNQHEGRPVAALATGFMSPKQKARITEQAKPHYEIVPIPKCAAEQYPRLVLGTNHISIFERTLPWDHAAGVLFLNEAGGKAARWDDSAYRPSNSTTGLLGASSPRLWEDAQRIFEGGNY